MLKGLLKDVSKEQIGAYPGIGVGEDAWKRPAKAAEALSRQKVVGAAFSAVESSPSAHSQQEADSEKTANFFDSPYYNILLFGDRFDKMEFIAECVPPKYMDSYARLLSQHEGAFVRAEGVSPMGGEALVRYDEDEGGIVVTTFSLLPFMRLLGYQNDDTADSFKQAMEKPAFQRALLVSLWQQEKGALREMVRAYQENQRKWQPLEAALVLYADPAIRTGATDTLIRENQVEKICERYQKSIPAFVYRKNDALLGVLRPHFKFSPDNKAAES